MSSKKIAELTAEASKKEDDFGGSEIKKTED
jgi:hypothetical protein